MHIEAESSDEDDDDASCEEMHDWSMDTLMWDVEVTRVAKEALFSLPPQLQTAAARTLHKLARGDWGSYRCSMMKRYHNFKDITVYQAKFARSGRIFWQKGKYEYLEKNLYKRISLNCLLD